MICNTVITIFSITLTSQKRYVYRWSSKNNGSVSLKWLFYCIETMMNVSGCIANSQAGNGLQLENFWPRFFQVCALVSKIK